MILAYLAQVDSDNPANSDHDTTVATVGFMLLAYCDMQILVTFCISWGFIEALFYKGWLTQIT